MTDHRFTARKLATWALLAALAPALAGCFGAAVVGVGAGALMLSDRRPSDTYVTDEAIELRSSKAINEKYGDSAHFNVTSYNRTVLITGEVPDAATKAGIEDLVASRPNVKVVVNELRILGTSKFVDRSNDAFITSKVKARFLEGNMSANLVKVVTEAGTVYLMGLVTRNEGDTASQIARETAGVKAIVPLYEYIQPDEAKRIDNRSSGSTKPARTE